MEVIHVPRPSKKAMDPDRPANGLLLAQVLHLQHAEKQLPIRYRSEIYAHTIKTEGEAARYIREVTEAIRQAHADAAKWRANPTPRHGLKTAVEAERPKRKRGSKKKNTKTIKRRKK